jgi:hypothetical protein
VAKNRSRAVKHGQKIRHNTQTDPIDIPDHISEYSSSGVPHRGRRRQLTEGSR